MRFTTIKSTNFRNIFSDTVINTDSENIILYGKNGQGKTNILECVYTLSYGSSFRTSVLKECTKHNEEGFSINGTFIDGDERGKVGISYYNKQRKIMLDGKEIKDRKSLIYQFPCIVFCHEDINFIKGEPEYRRRFFDQMMSLYSPLYFDNLRLYKSILAQRNAAIKNCDVSIIKLFDERLAIYGLAIMEERCKAVYEFNKIFPSLFSAISDTNYNLEISYQPSWKNLASIDEVVDELNNTIERDIKMCTTTSGIHRDRFAILSQYGSFTQMGSTGQLRLCSLLFRIAEAIYYTKMTNKEPILLIDDVLLELDSKKRGNVLSSLPPYSQAFFTFLPNEEYNESMKNYKKYEVEGGVLYER